MQEGHDRGNLGAATGPLASGPLREEPSMMLGLSAVFMVMTFVVSAGYGVFAAAVPTHLVDRPRVVTRVRQVFAVSFAGLGLGLATTDR